MRKYGDRVILIIKLRNNIVKKTSRSVVQFADKNNFIFAFAKFFDEQFSSLFRPLGGTGNKKFGVNFIVEKSFCHDRCIFFTTLIEWTIKIAQRGRVPTAFSMPD